jgi:outer membrane protein TolC
MMKTIFFIILFFSLSVFASSFSPYQIADLAEQRAPLIKMQIENRNAASRNVSQARLYSNPVLAIQSGSLKSATQSGAVVDVTLGQPLPWPGKKQADINSAKILEKITETDLEESRLIVHHSVSLLGMELAALTELARHNQERKNRFFIIQKFLNSRPMASPVQKVERNLIETQIRLVETQMFEIESKRLSVIKQLEELSGESNPDIKFQWTILQKLRPKEEYASLLEQGIDFRRTEKMRELAVTKVDQANYFAKPDILLGLNYRQENVAPTNHFYHANVAVVIPIIDRGQHSVEAARANVRMEEANKKLVLMNAINALNRSYQALTSSHHATQIFKISDLKKIEQQFAQAEDAFKKGRIDVTTFLQSDMQIHDSIDLAYTSYIKFYTALSEIKLLTGQRLEIK